MAACSLSTATSASAEPLPSTRACSLSTARCPPSTGSPSLKMPCSQAQASLMEMFQSRHREPRNIRSGIPRHQRRLCQPRRHPGRCSNQYHARLRSKIARLPHGRLGPRRVRLNPVADRISRDRQSGHAHLDCPGQLHPGRAIPEPTPRRAGSRSVDRHRNRGHRRGHARSPRRNTRQPSKPSAPHGILLLTISIEQSQARGQLINQQLGATRLAGRPAIRLQGGRTQSDHAALEGGAGLERDAKSASYLRHLRIARSTALAPASVRRRSERRVREIELLGVVFGDQHRRDDDLFRQLLALEPRFGR